MAVAGDAFPGVRPDRQRLSIHQPAEAVGDVRYQLGIVGRALQHMLQEFGVVEPMLLIEGGISGAAFEVVAGGRLAGHQGRAVVGGADP
ncbi:hypothetical protein D3C78_1187050 [compost metagenome]